MKLRVEVELDGRHATIKADRNAALAYGRWSESRSEEDWSYLIDCIGDDVREAILIQITDVEIGR